MSGVPKAKGVEDFLYQPETGRCYYYDENLQTQNPTLVKVARTDERVVSYFADVDRKYAEANDDPTIVDLTPKK